MLDVHFLKSPSPELNPVSLVLSSFSGCVYLKGCYHLVECPPFLGREFFMSPPAEGRSGAYSVSPWCYVRTCVCHVRNQVQVYLQV